LIGCEQSVGPFASLPPEPHVSHDDDDDDDDDDADADDADDDAHKCH